MIQTNWETISAISQMIGPERSGMGRMDVDLFPKEIEAEYAKPCDFLYDNVNNGVYKAGFAARQRPYEISRKKLFDALDQLEQRLSKNRYLFDNRIVEADWRLFCTLVRFDVVYHGQFKCNIHRNIDYPNLARLLDGFVPTTRNRRHRELRFISSGTTP